MGVATVGSQYEVLAFDRLERKAEITSASERTSNPLKHRRQLSDIDEHIGRKREIEIAALRLQELDQIAANEGVVDLALARGLDHVGGHVDPGERSGERTKSRSDKAGAAPHVQNV